MVKSKKPKKEKTEEEIMELAARKSWLSTEQFVWMHTKIEPFVQKQAMVSKRGMANEFVDAYINILIGEFEERWKYQLAAMDLPTHGLGGTPQQRSEAHFYVCLQCRVSNALSFSPTNSVSDNGFVTRLSIPLPLELEGRSS
jgi:hypothetical protein